MDITMFNILLLNLLPTSDISLLIEILKFENINNVVYFHCNSVETTISIQKVFHSNQIRIASLKSDYNAPFGTSYSKTGMVLNTSCERWTHAFQRIHSKGVFKRPFMWYIIAEDLSSTLDALSQYPIEVDSDVTIIYKKQKNFFKLYEVYSTGVYTGGKFYSKEIGHWNSTLHIEKRNRMDLSGVVLKCTVVVTETIANETFEQYVERSKYSKSDTLHKLKYFTLLKYLRDFYNFSYDVVRINSWGYLHNGSFDGMVGTLQRHEADVGGSPIFFRLERAQVVDATIEVWPSRPVFILRHPKHSGGYYSIFSRPLTVRVWCCILALLSMSAAILCLMFQLKMLKTAGDDEDSSTSLAFLMIWSILCQQGASLTKSSNSIKTLMFVTSLFMLTTYQYYNATVVSTLLRDTPKNIRTPKDLLKSNLKAGIHDVLYNKDFFKRTTDPIALQMYNKKIVTATEQNFFSLEYGVARVKKGGFAFLVDNMLAYGIMKYTFTESELCEAHEVPLYPPQNMVAVVKKGSPYREHFTYGLRKMFEAGLMRRIKSRWDSPRPACVRGPGSGLGAVSVEEFCTPLALLAGGMLAAAGVLACELLVARMGAHPVNGNYFGFRQKCGVAAHHPSRNAPYNW